jgi:type IV secretion system protein VirD4
MQLAATEELVLVSGLPPIRAKKLRYYEEEVFAERLLPAPKLQAGQYVDRPEPRADDWNGSVRATDQRLTSPEDKRPKDDDSSPEQQRQPGLSEQVLPDASEIAPDLATEDQEGDPAIDAKPIEQVRARADGRGAFALDETDAHQKVVGLGL